MAASMRVVWGSIGCTRIANSKGERILEVQARRWRGWVGVCVRSSTLQAFIKALRSFTHKELKSAFFIHKDPFLY